MGNVPGRTDPSTRVLRTYLLPLAVSSVSVILSSLAIQSSQAPAVAVGQPILEFTAPDENGDIFDSASLHGKPILLKFFRGHW